MALLLSYAQQQAIRSFGGLNSTNQQAEKKYDQLAEEVESLEIDKLLGSAFYQDVSANPTESKYVDLLDGAKFKDCYGNTVTHKGLRYVIAYLNYEKWVGESYVNDTWTGFTQKTRPDSERLSSGDIKRKQQDYREIAFNAFRLVKDYIEQNCDIYTLWNQSSNKRTKKPVFYGVKRTQG